MLFVGITIILCDIFFHNIFIYLTLALAVFHIFEDLGKSCCFLANSR